MSLAEKYISSPDENEALVHNIKALMLERHLNEAELARQSNIPQPTLHRLLAGNTFDPRISTLRQLAHYFNISLDELWSLKGKAAVLGYPLNKVQITPILNWHDCIQDISTTLKLREAENYIITQATSPSTFALISKPSMEPQFKRNTLLIISPDIEPADGDFVLVHFHATEEATLRELSLDGPNKLLISSGHTRHTENLDTHIRIIGTLIESRFLFHKLFVKYT